MEKNTNILLLECFMRGETSPDEERILSDWLHSQEAKEQLSNYYQETWKGSNNKLIAEVQGRMFERVKSQMHNAAQELNRLKQKRTMRIRRLFQYAAIILLIIGAGIGGHLYTVSLTEPTVTDKSYLVQTGKGQRANITLPDGTVVWLNSYTQLHYNANYGATQRVVSLTGEAYFEVAKDKEKPFIVETAGMNVEALGTTFNVKAYREDSQIIATLFPVRSVFLPIEITLFFLLTKTLHLNGVLAS
ncbi:FecR family protein [Bacteroides sp. BFG-637]|nr:FecR family protein [Bacteroides sp. BFG-637]